MTGLRIRPAGQGDAPQFSELNRRFNNCPGRLADRDERTETVIVAEIEGALVGFACVRILRSVCSDAPSAELTELFVDETARRRGVGAALVAEAERVSCKNGCSELLLRTRTDNHGARALFDRCGFEDAQHTTYRKRIRRM